MTKPGPSKKKKMSISCVFFPDEETDELGNVILSAHDLHGKHSNAFLRLSAASVVIISSIFEVTNSCHCHSSCTLYIHTAAAHPTAPTGMHPAVGSDPCYCRRLYHHHPEAEHWPAGHAPWGCGWFKKWTGLVTEAVSGYGQEAVVVYKRGMRGDDMHGLGYSQQGEVAWMKANGIEIKHKWDTEDFEFFARAANNEEVWVGAASWPFFRTCTLICSLDVGGSEAVCRGDSRGRPMLYFAES
jgi:hypothetical protein